jgi:short-subunit dehydrogenase
MMRNRKAVNPFNLTVDFSGVPMPFTLKPLKHQVIVITGASSGIGLATAKMAARKGASVVLAARNKEALDTIAAEINRKGGVAMSYALDVAHRDQVEKLAEATIARFGRIDTWVNDAGIGVWGKLEEVPNEDSRRMFDTNFWGVVNGSLVAVKHMKEKGGAIINLGSLASEMGLPLQAMYAATKHAIKGFTDGLRLELMSEKAPVSVTLIRPAAIGTPFGEKAKNFLAQEPQLPPPLYKVEDVAIAILFAARHPRRDIYVGGGSRLMSAFNHILPSMMDRMTVKSMAAEVKNEPARPRRDNLFSTASEGLEKGRDLVQAPAASLYTQIITHPVTTLAVVAAGAGLIAALGAGVHESRQPRTRVKRFLRDQAAPLALKYGRSAAEGARDWIQEEAAPRAWKYGKRYAGQARDWAIEEGLPRGRRLSRHAAEEARDFIEDEVSPRARKYAKRAKCQARCWWKRHVD